MPLIKPPLGPRCHGAIKIYGQPKEKKAYYKAREEAGCEKDFRLAQGRETGKESFCFRPETEVSAEEASRCFREKNQSDRGETGQAIADAKSIFQQPFRRATASARQKS